MTVAAQNTAVSYTANGVTTVFAYTMRILDALYLRVYLNGILQVAGYTVDNVGAQLGGNVTFAVAPANGVIVLLQRATAQDQLVDYTPYDPFPSETHETALDKLTMLVQEGIAKADHAITIPPNEATVTQLPSAALRANGFVAFDGAGNVIIAAGSSGVAVTPFMATLLDDADAPTARTTLGIALTTKGDLLVGTGGGAVARKAVGGNGLGLIADSTQGDGLKWGSVFNDDNQLDIATAATPAIFAAINSVIRLTGTTDITAFDAGAAGKLRLCHVQTTGARLVNGANLQNPIPFDIQMMAGDSFIVEALGGGVSKIHHYIRADGQRLLGGRIPFTVINRGILNAGASTTMYAAPNGFTQLNGEIDAEIIIPEACTVSELRLVASAAIAGGTAVATIRKNRADTSITCTLNAGAGTTASDVVHTVDFNEGERLALKLVTGAIGGVTDFGFTFVIKKKGMSVGVPMQFAHNPYSRGNLGNSCAVWGAGATLADHEWMPGPCQVQQRAPYMAASGTTGPWTGWNILKNGAYASISSAPVDAMAYAVVAGTGAVPNPGQRGAVHGFAEGDLTNLRGDGAVTNSDWQYNMGVMQVLSGADERQYPPSQMLFHCIQQAQALARYMGGFIGDSEALAQSATETDVQVPMPACTLRNLRAVCGSAPAAGQTFTFTVRKNGVDTGLTCQVTSAGRTASDLANAVVFAAGDILTVKCVSSATSGTRSATISIEVNPV